MQALCVEVYDLDCKPRISQKYCIPPDIQLCRRVGADKHEGTSNGLTESNSSSERAEIKHGDRSGRID
jgi:hypothetical protein